MKIVNKIIGIIQILISPKGGIRYLISRTRSIASFGINSALYKIDSSIKTIIDVGANVGQYAYATYTFYPDAIIHSFEPVPETFAQLKLNTHKIEKIKIYSCALGDSEGTIDFFQNEHSHASSALEVSKEQKEALPETKNYKKIQVPVHKLDNFDFGVSLEKPILLKMDVQGFEMQVLQGGNNFLKSVEYLLLEMSFVQMYKNEPLFDEMHQYIKEKGFVLVGPVGFLPSGNQQIMQMDMLYRKNRG